jgi:hypothetical protein
MDQQPGLVKEVSAMSDVSKVIVTGVLALITALILALVNSSISARAGIDENLRAKRLELYPVLWDATKAISRWPRVDITRGSLEDLHGTLRSWYYEKGGLFLSESARDRYSDVQALIEALLTDKGDPDCLLAKDAYRDLMETASAMRTALTQDLNTRRRQSFLETWRRSRWHKKEESKAKTRIQTASDSKKPNFTPKQRI